MRKLLVAAAVLLDSAAVFLAMFIAGVLKFHSGLFQGTTPIPPLIIASGSMVSVPFWLALFFVTGIYRLKWDLSWADEMSQVFKQVTGGIVILSLGAFLVSPAISVGRWIFFIYYGLLLILVFMARAGARLIERRLAKKGIIRRNALVIGLGKKAGELVTFIEANRALGYRVVGFVKPPGAEYDEGLSERIAGHMNELDSLIEKHNVEEILVTIASNFHDDILGLLLPAAGKGIRVKVVPDLFDVIAGHVHSTQILGQPLMELLPDRLKNWEKLAKTIMDFIICLFVLVLGLPLWLLIALAIRLDSPGPVFYRQTRAGKGGREFRIVKFRSMVKDAETGSGAVWAGRNDPRVTRLGGLLRKTRMDEVPQLLNILAGHMSLVGPRPERPEIIAKLREVFPFYNKRLTIKPGLTGWAQVKLEYDSSLEDVAEKLKYDFFYIENQSLFLDIEILLRTVKVVLTGAGAH